MAVQLTNYRTIEALENLLVGAQDTAKSLALLATATQHIGTNKSNEAIVTVCVKHAEALASLQQRLSDLVDIRIAGAYDDGD